jgi:succinate dehydrogenase subunit D
MAEERASGASGSVEMHWGDVLDASDRREITPPARGGPTLVIPGKEPIFWSLFSAGGFVAALLIPAHVVILGIAFAAGWLPKEALSYDRVLHLVRHPIAKLYLLALVALPLYHWAHRFRFAIHHQFGIHGLKRLVAVGCYGTAIAGTVLVLLILLTI